MTTSGSPSEAQLRHCRGSLIVATAMSRLPPRLRGPGTQAWCPWMSALKRRLRAGGVCVSQARGAVTKPPPSCACSPWDCQAVPLGFLKEVSFLFFFLIFIIFYYDLFVTIQYILSF